MYTPVLFAAQMGLGWMRGITTCPSMNPYLQKKQQQLATCEAGTVSHPIPSNDMSCRTTLHSTHPEGMFKVSASELYEIQK